MAMSEEQHVATEVWEVRPPGTKSLIGESQLGKASEGFGPRVSLATAVFTCLPLSFFSGVNECGESPLTLM